MGPLTAPGRRVRAAVLDRPGQPVRVTEVELAQPRAGEVEVAVAAAGVCHSDLHIVLGDWPHPVPLVLGHEGSGVVAAGGPGVTTVSPGATVAVIGLPPSGQQAKFNPLALAEADQRILGCNYGSITPQRDIPRLVDLAMTGDLELESMVSARRPLAEAADALADLRSGRTLRQLLVCAPG